MLRWITTGFAVVTVVAVWQHDRQGAARYALERPGGGRRGPDPVWTALTGDAGAQAVWG